MELPSSRKKSLKKPTNELSLFSDLEEQPILSNHNNSNIQESNTNSLQSGNTNAATMDCREVIVKIDPSGTSSEKKTRQDNKYGLWADGVPNNDPPSKLIGQFIDRQRAAGGEVAFDVDFNNDRNNNANLCPEESPPKISIAVDQIKKKHQKIPSKDIKSSFQGPSNGDDSDHGTSEEEDVVGEMRSNTTSSQFQNSKVLQENRPNSMQGDGEVLKCTSFQQRQAAVLRSKTRSRLLDNPDNDSKTSGKVKNKSGQIKSTKIRASGMLKQQTTEEEEEDDPFKDDDIPDEFKNKKVSIWTILQWVGLVIIVAALTCTLVIREWKEKMFKGLQVWKWEVLILVLICGRLVSGWGIRLIVFFIERNFLLRKRVLYFVYGVKDAVQNCIWLGLVLLAWRFLFDEKIEKETNTNFLHIVNKILLCLLVGSVLWLIKTLMVKVLASSFHVSTFFDRIQDSLFNQHVIETLSGPPTIEIQTIQEEEDRAMAEIQQLQSMGINVPPELRSTTFTTTLKSGQLRPQARTVRDGSSRIGNFNNNNKQQEGIPIHQVHQWNPKNISAWNMKRLTKMVRHGMLSTLDDQIHGASGDESSTQIRNEYEAKVAARKIFQNVARSGSKNISLLDLMRFMPEEEAFKTMALLSGSPEREKISKSALKSWVVNAFRERKALALSLNDTKTAVNKLHYMVNVLVSIIILAVCLLILGIATTQFFILLSSQLLVAAFVFGNTCKTIFESIIFLFVMHPFDVGDRCEVDGVQLIVEEMNILNTIFLRADNQKVYFPNSTLSQKPLGNYYRSPDMCDTVDFLIHITTPAEKIVLVKQRILSYVENKIDHWYNDPTMVLLNVEELDKVQFSLWTRHRMNHQDMKERYLRRALLVEEIIKIFKEYDIEYRLCPKDINIRSMPALTRTPDTWISPNK